jgi:hypothetical protein
MTLRTCTRCNSALTLEDRSCRACGHPLLPVEPPPNVPPGPHGAHHHRSVAWRPAVRLCVYIAVTAVVTVTIAIVAQARAPVEHGVPASLVAASKSNSAARAEERGRLAAIAEAAANADRCSKVFRPLLAALHGLDDDLDIGVTFLQYTNSLKRANRRYQSAGDSLNDVTPNCLRVVGRPAESTLRTYVAAKAMWYRCGTTISCTFDALTRSLRHRWADAHRTLKKASKALNDLVATGDPATGSADGGSSAASVRTVMAA